MNASGKKNNYFSLNKPSLARLLLSLSLSLSLIVIDTYNFSTFLTFGTEPVFLERGTGFFVFPPASGCGEPMP
jgi:hypothetical protein